MTKLEQAIQDATDAIHAISENTGDAAKQAAKTWPKEWEAVVAAEKKARDLMTKAGWYRDGNDSSDLRNQLPFAQWPKEHRKMHEEAVRAVDATASAYDDFIRVALKPMTQAILEAKENMQAALYGMLDLALGSYRHDIEKNRANIRKGSQKRAFRLPSVCASAILLGQRLGKKEPRAKPTERANAHDEADVRYNRS